jgi:hypothetical protein
MKISTIQIYKNFMARVAADEDIDHLRYKSLENFLGMVGGKGVRPVEGAEGDYKPSGDEYDPQEERGREVARRMDQGRARKQQESFVGQHGMNEQMGMMFSKLLKDYVPGGFLADPVKMRGVAGTPEIHDIVKNFYRMAYQNFKKILPKILAKKTKDYHIDRDKAIQFTPEVINTVIADALVYFHKYPDEVKLGLARAYTNKFRADEDESEKKRRLSVGQAFFRPKVDESYYKEVTKNPDVVDDKKDGDIDTGVLASLQAAKDAGRGVKFKWVGIDDAGVLTFELPDLYGDRKFTILMPPDVTELRPEDSKTMRPGTYELTIRDVKKNGAVIEFTAQKDEMLEGYVRQVESKGLGEDQLKKFINNGFINRYATILAAQPLEQFIEDFGGGISIGGEQVSSVQDLADLGTVSADKEVAKSERTLSKLEEAELEQEAQQDALTQEVVKKWSADPALQRHFLKMTPDEGHRITQAVASKFPEESEKKAISFSSILATRPVVEYALNYILSESPKEFVGGGGQPWLIKLKGFIQRDALKDPVLFKQFAKLMQAQQAAPRKPRTPKSKPSEAPGVLTPVPVPGTVPTGVPIQTAVQAAEVAQAPQAVPTPSPTVQEVQAFLQALPDTMYRKSLQQFREEILDAVRASASDPALQKFFEKRRTWLSYLGKQIQRFKDQLIYLSELDLSDPGDAEYYKTQCKKLGVIKPEKLSRNLDEGNPEHAAEIDSQLDAFKSRLVKKTEQPGLAMTASTLDPVMLQRVLTRAHHLVTTGQRS